MPRSSRDGTVPTMASRAPRTCSSRPAARIAGLPSRLVSSLGLALVLLAQLFSLVHMGVVRHERCAEHGELVEVSPGAAAATSSLAHEEAWTHGGAPGDEGALPSVSSGAPAEHDGHDEHDHCQLALTPAVSSPAHQVLHHDLPLLLDVDLPAATPAPLVATDRLDVAPKTSPPARA